MWIVSATSVTRVFAFLKKINQNQTNNSKKFTHVFALGFAGNSAAATARDLDAKNARKDSDIQLACNVYVLADFERPNLLPMKPADFRLAFQEEEKFEY